MAGAPVAAVPVAVVRIYRLLDLIWNLQPSIRCGVRIDVNDVGYALSWVIHRSIGRAHQLWCQCWSASGDGLSRTLKYLNTYCT